MAKAKALYQKVAHEPIFHKTSIGRNPSKCKMNKSNAFTKLWKEEIYNSIEHPLLRLYKTFKSNFLIEPHLVHVRNPKYRRAITALRSSSHCLQIETGRHKRPKTPVECRTCYFCNEVESEMHFVNSCKINNSLRLELFSKLESKFPVFTEYSISERFELLMTSEEPQILTWFGKFLYQSFCVRETALSRANLP